jgi:uncharacterized protein (TIGR02246 family)
MKSPGILAAALLTLASTVGCSTPQADDREADRAAIASMYATRLETIQAAGTIDQILEAYVATLADDAVWMPPNSPAVVGKEAINSWARDFFSRYTLDVDSLPVEVLEVGNELAVRRFRSVGRYIPSDGGEPVPYDQKYVDILRRQPDGSWSIALHMWSSNTVGQHYLAVILAGVNAA